MLRHKIKVILALAIIFALVFCPFANAENEEDVEIINNEENAETVDNEEYATEEETDKNTNESSDDNTKHSDVYIFDNEVTIDYPVDGNAFIFANTVNIKSKISGDVYVCANTVNIEDAYIYSNLFACANTLNINGVVYDVYAACSKTEILENGYVYRDLHSGSDTLNIYGTVGRNAFVEANKISLVKQNAEGGEELQGTIYGDFNYTTNNELENLEDMVEGTVSFNKITAKSNSWTDILLSIITSIVFAILVYLAIIWLAPNFTKKLNETLTKNIAPVIGFGILSLILLPLIAFILLLTSIGSSVALLLFALYGILITLSSTIFIIAISNIISDKANIYNKFAKIGIVAGITLLISLLKLIPFVSVLVTLICVWLGTGITIKQLLPLKKSEI